MRELRYAPVDREYSAQILNRCERVLMMIGCSLLFLDMDLVIFWTWTCNIRAYHNIRAFLSRFKYLL